MKIKKWNGSTWVQDYPEVNVSSIVATGTPSSSTFLRGDGTWATPSYSTGDITGVTAGNGLTGGGTSGDVTLTVGSGTGISVAATTVSIANAYSPNTAIELTSAQNLNDITTAGFYYQTANADTSGNNYPSGEAGSLLVQKSAGLVTQTYTTYSTDPKVYVRTYYTSWSSWVRVFTDNYHPNADTLTTARTIALAGDVTGSASFNGSANISITATVADDSHNHIIGNIDGLQTALDSKQNTSTALTTSTSFGGDVSGTYNAIVVANDSHTHDGRYYTESESDSRFAILSASSNTFSGEIYANKFIIGNDSDGGNEIPNWAFSEYNNKPCVSSEYISDTYYPIYHEGNMPPGSWTEIYGGQTTVTGGTGTTTVTLSSGSLASDDIIAIEFHTIDTEGTYSTSIQHVKLGSASSNLYSTVMFPSYDAGINMRITFARVWLASSTQVSFSYGYYTEIDGSPTVVSDTFYVGKIWKINGVTGV